MRERLHKASNMPLLSLIEAGGVNDKPVIMPAAATSDTLIEAVKIVRAAGYRVSKPRASKRRNPKDRVGPTCVCTFADGTVTRMSVFTSLEKLDWERGERLSIAAYQSRWQTCEAPPAIISAHFEQDGKVLAQRNGESAP